jgi:hypothetical protein
VRGHVSPGSSATLPQSKRCGLPVTRSEWRIRGKFYLRLCRAGACHWSISFRTSCEKDENLPVWVPALAARRKSCAVLSGIFLGRSCSSIQYLPLCWRRCSRRGWLSAEDLEERVILRCLPNLVWSARGACWTTTVSAWTNQQGEIMPNPLRRLPA